MSKQGIPKFQQPVMLYSPNCVGWYAGSSIGLIIYIVEFNCQPFKNKLIETETKVNRDCSECKQWCHFEAENFSQTIDN